MKLKQVAIQGVSGAFHEIAARAYFGREDIDIVQCDTFGDLFDSLKNDSEKIGIVAIENTIAGSLLQNHALLAESGKVIVGEYKLRIKQCICALPRQTLADIKEVQSHPIALMQCGEFLNRHKHIRAVEAEDTALSAKNIADKRLMGVGAICSSMAAHMYGLEVLEDGIETNKKNFTRFLIVADKENVADLLIGKNINKASLMFTLPNEEGSLAKILCILSFYHVNLTKIQSLPIIGRTWEYQFYITPTFDNYERYRAALDAVRPLLKDLMILGEYEQAETPA